jgi:hypothetical protein
MTTERDIVSNNDHKPEISEMIQSEKMRQNKRSQTGYGESGQE